MARFAVGAAALFALCRADGWGAKPGQFGYDDSKKAAFEFPNPKSIPGHDKCGVDCYRICQDGLGRHKTRNMFSYSECTNSCYAHSIETPHEKQSLFDTNRQQGKYLQKVMAEYCSRGVCGAGLLQAAAVHEHQQKEGGAYSPGAEKGDPRAMPSGWPSGCESQGYYCQEVCQNLYHKPVGSMGEHFGASKSTWSRDVSSCKTDCSGNFKAMTKYWDEWCECYQSPGGDMKLTKVPGLLQQEQELESVDVGSFMQLPAEL